MRATANLDDTITLIAETDEEVMILGKLVVRGANLLDWCRTDTGARVDLAGKGCQIVGGKMGNKTKDMKLKRKVFRHVSDISALREIANGTNLPL